jgi:hypothetical protein
MILKDLNGELEAEVNIDVVGIGTSIYDHAKGVNLKAHGLNGGAASKAKDKSGRLGFVNKRAQWHWRLREYLDPESGQDIALPPDPVLFADLCAPRWSITPRGIKIEPKICEQQRGERQLLHPPSDRPVARLWRKCYLFFCRRSARVFLLTGYTGAERRWRSCNSLKLTVRKRTVFL